MQLDYDSNNYKLLHSFSPELNVRETGVVLLKGSLDIDVASGVDLDNLAKLFLQTRNENELDEAFRGRIKAFFQTAIKSGSEIGMKESLVSSLNLNIDDITLITVYENIFDLDIKININTETSIFNGIRSIVNKGKAAGVHFRSFMVSSSNDVFLIDLSYVDGKDYIN